MKCPEKHYQRPRIRCVRSRTLHKILTLSGLYVIPDRTRSSLLVVKYSYFHIQLGIIIFSDSEFIMDTKQFLYAMPETLCNSDAQTVAIAASLFCTQTYCRTLNNLSTAERPENQQISITEHFLGRTLHMQVMMTKDDNLHASNQ